MRHHLQPRNQASFHLQVDGDIPARLLHGLLHLLHQDGHRQHQRQQDQFLKSMQWSHCFSAITNFRTIQRFRIYSRSSFSTKAQSKRTFTNRCSSTHTSWAWCSLLEFPVDSILPTIMPMTPSRTSKDRIGERSSFLLTTTRMKRQIGYCRIVWHTLSPDPASWI